MSIVFQEVSEDLSFVREAMEQKRDLFTNQKNSSELIELVGKLNRTMRKVNWSLFHTEKIEGNEALNFGERLCEEENIELMIYLEEVKKWIALVANTIDYRKALKTYIDQEFYKFMDYIKYCEYNTIVEYVIKNLKEIQKEDIDFYFTLKCWHNEFSHFWGKIDLNKDEFELINNRVRELKNHQDEFIWLYNELADYRSKKVFLGIIRFWITFDYDEKNSIVENNFSDYYDLDLVKCDENEVFVDLGAFNGDSIKSFIHTYGMYKHIYAYEITTSTVEELKKNLISYSNITIRQKGVGDKKGEMFIKDNNVFGESCNLVSSNGDRGIEIVSIDEDIKEKITFIKMDIEGSEQAAIEGCKNHIINEHPKLAICTYHKIEDIWKIPKRIKEMNPDYKLYMRYNGKKNGFSTTEFVTFAL